MSGSVTIGLKEIRDHLRDRRSLRAAALYALMGPVVILLVSQSAAAERGGSGLLLSMMSVFALVSAFTGGIYIALDSTAGERERGSLVPLLLNPVSRRDVIVGKWIGVSFFSLAGLVLTLDRLYSGLRVGRCRTASGPRSSAAAVDAVRPGAPGTVRRRARSAHRRDLQNGQGRASQVVDGDVRTHGRGHVPDLLPRLDRAMVVRAAGRRAAGAHWRRTARRSGVRGPGRRARDTDTRRHGHRACSRPPA